MNQEEIIESLNNFQFKACKMSDEKTAKVYKNLKKEVRSRKPQASQPGGDQRNFQQSSFGQRLQTENPFEEFRLAVERAVIEKSQ